MEKFRDYLFQFPSLNNSWKDDFKWHWTIFSHTGKAADVERFISETVLIEEGG